MWFAASSSRTKISHVPPLHPFSPGGQPVHPIDAACRELAEGYDCARIDTFEEGSNECAQPYLVEYDSNVGGDGPNLLESLRKGCLDDNPEGGCAYRVCTIEAHFIANLLSHFMNDYGTVDDSLRHSNGFNPKTMCHGRKPGTTTTAAPTTTSIIVTGGEGDGEDGEEEDNLPEKSCCGHYPIRHPYRVDHGNRGCCGSKTYNVNVLTCCDSQHSVLRVAC